MKKLLCLTLAVTMVIVGLVLPLGTFSASAEFAPPNPNRLPEYTPSPQVNETFNINFAMPGAWMGAAGSDDRAAWEKYGSSAGIYWWGSLDNPDEAPAAAGHGWPGWKMKKGDKANLYTSLVPKGTASMIFSNFIDGGFDTSYPEYNASQQTKDLTNLEFFGQGDSDYYPLEFWDYLYDDYYDAMVDYPGYQIAEFGDYAKNFFYNEDEDSIYHRINDMVFVVDTVNTDRAVVAPVSGKVGLAGAFYFYYGNGEFGIWPTKAMCIEKEGLKVDGNGDVLLSEETVQEKTDFVLRNHTDAYDCQTKRDFVVYGNFTGKYWEGSIPPEANPIDPDTQEYLAPNVTIPNYSSDKIYFYANSALWKNFKTISAYIYEKTNYGYEVLINWGSNKGKMTYVGNGYWAFDLDKVGITLERGKQYGVIFTADWGAMSCDLILDRQNLGDVAYLNGNMVENNVDSNKLSYIVRWKSGHNGNPVCITSIGNVIGDTYWQGDSAYGIFRYFLISDGKDGLSNAIKFNGKNEQQTIDDTATALGLTLDQVKAAVSDAKTYGRNCRWDPELSSLYLKGKLPAPTLYVNATGGGNVSVNWSSVNGAAHYILYSKRDSDKNWTSQIVYSGSGIGFGTTEKNAVYHFQIQAVSHTGEKGVFSPVKTITINPVYSEKPVVTLSNKSNGIRVDWKAISGATKNIVYYKKTADANWNWAETTNNYYPLLNLTAGTNYVVQVQPVYGSTKGAYSKAVQLTYIPQVKPTLKLSNKSNGIRAEWNTFAGASKYIVYYRKASSSTWSSVETKNNYYPLLNLSAGTNYAVQVQPVFGSSKGMYSSVAQLVYVPQVKPTVKLSNKSNGIRAEWNKFAAATKYIVYYRKASSSTWTSVQTTNTYYPLLGLAAGTNYVVQVQPVFGSAKGMYSTSAQLVYIPQVKPTLKLSKKSNGIRAEWNKFAAATKYIVYYKKTTDSKWSVAETKNTYYPLLNLKKGATYAVQVQPVFGNAKGLYSTASTMTY